LTPPKSFTNSLSVQLPHLRIRWSNATQQWHIEQKVGRQTLPKHYVKPNDDRAIRLRDGMEFVLAITPGDRAGCPQCGTTVHVPVMCWKEAKCSKCQHTFRAMYWPLNDALLEHLRWSDPYRSGLERVWKDLTEGEARQARVKRRDRNNYLEDATRDLYNGIHGIPTFGYTTSKELR
jgi:hypothetical protein